MAKDVDIAIIGAGPAGLAAAIYTAREDLTTLVLDKSVAGGLAALTGTIDNYPGFPASISGPDLADALQAQAERFGAKIKIMQEVLALKTDGDLQQLETAAGPVQARAVLIATGNHYKKLEVPGEAEFNTKGVHYCATCDGPLYRDKVLAVVGGGNSAMQEGLFLTKFASRVILLVRGGGLKGTQALIDKVDAHPKMEVRFDTKVKAIRGDTLVNAVEVEDAAGASSLQVSGVFIFVGLVPNTDWLQGSAVRLDERGFVITGGQLMTAQKGVFAAGDVRHGSQFQLASVVGEGVAAALAIREYLAD